MTEEKKRYYKKVWDIRKAAIEKEGRFLLTKEEWLELNNDSYLQVANKKIEQQQAKEAAAEYAAEIEKRINELFKKFQ